jgi:hypothetical protein
MVCEGGGEECSLEHTGELSWLIGLSFTGLQTTKKAIPRNSVVQISLQEPGEHTEFYPIP